MTGVGRCTVTCMTGVGFMYYYKENRSRSGVLLQRGQKWVWYSVTKRTGVGVVYCYKVDLSRSGVLLQRGQE
jgi:hypothetical protein